MAAQWTRTHAVLGAQEATDVIAQGTPWVILWCGGRISRSTDDPVDRAGLAAARRRLVEPTERERLVAKARRTHRTKTVVIAERWEHPRHGTLVVLCEGGPDLPPEREDPVRV